MNGFEVADDSVFLYSNGLKTSKRFNDVMKFKTYVLEYKGSTEWVEPKVLEIKNFKNCSCDQILNNCVSLLQISRSNLSARCVCPLLNLS